MRIGVVQIINFLMRDHPFLLLTFYFALGGPKEGRLRNTDRTQVCGGVQCHVASSTVQYLDGDGVPGSNQEPQICPTHRHSAHIEVITFK